MEILTEIHTRKRIFAGRVPKSSEEALNPFSLMIGTSPILYAKNARSHPHSLLQSKNGPKRLSQNSPITSMLLGHYLQDGNTQLTLEIVEGLLKDRTGGVSVSSRLTHRALLRQQWAKSHKLSILQLLDAMRDATAAEQCALRFDYVSFHLRCLSLLENLVDVLGDKVQRNLLSMGFYDEINGELLPSLIVHYIFTACAAFDGNLRDAKGWRFAKDGLVMEQQSAIVAGFIEKEGRVEFEKLKKMGIRCQSGTILE